MTREEESIDLLDNLIGMVEDNHDSDYDTALKMAIKSLEFTEWVIKELFSNEWEYNKDSFGEIACRKLAKLGFVKEVDGEWLLAESEDEG